MTGHFWANFGYVSRIPVIGFSCLCACRVPFGCRMTVQIFMKIVWTVFEKFELFMKGREKKNKKKNDCISSRNFFPTPKNPLTISIFQYLGQKTQRHEIQISQYPLILTSQLFYSRAKVKKSQVSKKGLSFEQLSSTKSIEQ